jgi:hypothetical protein
VSTEIDVFNPTAETAAITMTYVLAGGGIVQVPHSIGPYSRESIDPASEDPLLAVGDFGVIIGALQPVVASGTTWWPGTTPSTWYAGAATASSPSTATRWAFADGEVGGARNSETEIAVTNVSPDPGIARVRLVFDDGSSVERDVALARVTHLVIDVGQLFPEALWKSFSAIVESLGVNGGAAPAIVVERATYTSPAGVPRAGGTRVGATPVSE